MKEAELLSVVGKECREEETSLSLSLSDEDNNKDIGKDNPVFTVSQGDVIQKESNTGREDSLLGSHKGGNSKDYDAAAAGHSVDYGGHHHQNSQAKVSLQESVQERLERLASMGSDDASAISFHDINYTVNVKVNPCARAVPKKILKSVSGLFKPGMNAVMGPTGSGKSSLLDVLAGRKDPTGLKGTILLDGLPPPENFKVLVGYVSQDDCVTGMLTIRENFAFSAALRLPQTVGKAERDQRVNKVIQELGLTKVADSKVGNEFIRGISGGERKRTNIGMELIISPPVLFLDEPTTGLDANTANSVMMLLKKMALRGRNIIFAIHQPRYSIYKLFDSLMLLSLGEVVYHGPSPESLSYFDSIGFECDRFNNPADFFLDVINADTALSNAQFENTKTKKSPLPSITNGGVYDGQPETHIELDDMQKHQDYLVQKYKDSTWHTKLSEELDPVLENLHKEMAAGTLVRIRKVDYKTSFMNQFVIVSGRAIKNLLRNPIIYIMQFVVIAIFALIVGTVYYQLNDSRGSAIQNRVGAFFFIVMNQVFGNMSAVEIFIKERVNFIHENTSGFYRVSSYFLAKVVCDLIPMRMVPCVIFSLVAYWMIDLQGGFEHFCIFTLTLFLTSLAASGLSFFISSSVSLFSIANLCLALCYVFMMLFSGLLINVGDILSWLSWIKYLSIFRFSLNALEINELKDRAFCGNSTSPSDVPVCPVWNITCAYGNAYLKGQSIDYESSWDLWLNNLALGIMVFGYLFLSYVQLRRMKKLK